jgi:hypothetical protein
MIEAVYVKATRVAMADHIGAEDIRGEDRVTCSLLTQAQSYGCSNRCAYTDDNGVIVSNPRVVVEVLSPTPEATDLRVLPVLC